MSHFVITGATGGSTQGAAAPNRLEINVFVKNDQYFSLYIQALRAMQQRPQDELTSYFQIGGIHGLPYIAWDAENAEPVSDEGWRGYCTHGSVLFPTWHRPYMMLYEQVLQRHAISIADTYTVNRAAWQKAAIELRQPFWDWAYNSVPPPEVISQQQVTITRPDGTRGAVPNPLFSYGFHPIDGSFPAPYNRWTSTLRHPANTRPGATSNPTRLARVLQSSQTDIRTKTYNLLTRVRTWPAFSNHSVGDGGSSSNSLEAIHDGIHVAVGGNGQMSDPSVAAFDPIFFLHHANVDRLLSMWAALHPGVWVTNGREDDGSFTIPPNSAVGPTTDLTPFWDSQEAFWASSGLLDTARLGYTYPEFNNLDMSNNTQVQNAIARVVDQLYSGSIFTSLSVVPDAGVLPPVIPQKPLTEAEIPAPPTTDPIVVPHTRSLVSRSVPRTSENLAPTHSSVHPENNQIRFEITRNNQTTTIRDIYDWTVRACFKKYELGTTFSVLFFLGPVPESPEEWLESENYVGAVHAFVNSSAARCANCRHSPDLQIEGFVHLDEAIASHSDLNSFDPDVVEPYLRDNLHWRVQKANEEAAELQSLEVTVIGTPLSMPPGAMFPIPGERHHYHGITQGQPGGSRQANA